MHRGIVGEAQLAKVFTPISRIAGDITAEHVKDGAIEAFFPTVGRWVVCSVKRLGDVVKLSYAHEELRGGLRSVVRQEGSGRAIFTHPVVYEIHCNLCGADAAQRTAWVSSVNLS